jgi:hypothetical protein
VSRADHGNLSALRDNVAIVGDAKGTAHVDDRYVGKVRQVIKESPGKEPVNAAEDEVATEKPPSVLFIGQVPDVAFERGHVPLDVSGESVGYGYLRCNSSRIRDPRANDTRPVRVFEDVRLKHDDIPHAKVAKQEMNNGTSPSQPNDADPEIRQRCVPVGTYGEDLSGVRSAQGWFRSREGHESLSSDAKSQRYQLTVNKDTPDSIARADHD